MELEVQDPPRRNGECQTSKKKKKVLGLTYIINESPPWYLCIVLGFQHYLTMVGSILAVPYIVAEPMCFLNNFLATSEVLSTMFFVSGIATLLQSTFGVRLPIVQGSSFTFLTPIFAILSLPKWKCPTATLDAMNSTLNSTPHSSVDDDIWKPRMREIQGAIMVSSLFQIVVGFSGMIGFFLRFIGPLAISPTISLVGLSLFPVAAERAGTHWGISSMTVVLIALFSQCMYNVKVPIPAYSRRRGRFIAHYPVFRLFPMSSLVEYSYYISKLGYDPSLIVNTCLPLQCVTNDNGVACSTLPTPVTCFYKFDIILAIALTWGVCGIITAAGGFPSDPNSPQYMARTDARSSVLKEAEWFRFPYPGQWGVPTVSAAGVFGMLAGVLASIIESIGDYYACARISGAPPPPRHAINRGIGMEGIGCFFTGIWGCGSGTTSYSENIGAIGITKVGSLLVMQFGAGLLMLIGVLGKIGALFTTIPDPIVGGVLLVMFGMITAVGVANLQFVDLNSSRNLFIIGFSLVLGLALPHYLTVNPDAIQTGVSELDQIITVLLRTHMAVGGLAGFILDNAVPGSREERGLIAWRKHVFQEESETEMMASSSIYNLPLGIHRLSKYKLAKYIPFLPYDSGVAHTTTRPEEQSSSG